MRGWGVYVCMLVRVARCVAVAVVVDVAVVAGDVLQNDLNHSLRSIDHHHMHII